MYQKETTNAVNVNDAIPVTLLLISLFLLTRIVFNF